MKACIKISILACACMLLLFYSGFGHYAVIDSYAENDSSVIANVSRYFVVDKEAPERWRLVEYWDSKIFYAQYRSSDKISEYINQSGGLKILRYDLESIVKNTEGSRPDWWDFAVNNDALAYKTDGYSYLIIASSGEVYLVRFLRN